MESNKQPIGQKTITGVGWSATDAILGQGITFLVGLVLARLLSPTEYGLIGIVMIFVVILNSIVDSGFSKALIRKQDADDDDYNTMFYTNLLVSFLLYIGLFSSAPLIAKFFERDELESLVPVMGLIVIINALSLVQYTILTKRIDFKTKTKISLFASVSSGVLGIASAFYGLGVWALVLQKTSQQILTTIFLWFFNKWRPSLQFSKKSFSYMWGFGWKLLASRLLAEIWGQFYKVVVAKFYSPATLGQYSRSREYADIFSSNLTAIVERVSYPALSLIQDEKDRLVAAYRRVIKVSMLVTAVCMFALGGVSEPLIYCLIGPQWHQASTFLPLICVSMSLYPMHAINLNMLQIQGRSDIYLYLEIIKKVIAVFPICLGIFVSIYWMLIGSIIVGIICFFLNTYYTGKKLGYTSWMQLRDIAPSYNIAFWVAVSVFFLKYLPLSYWIILPIQIVVGTLVFFVICEKSHIEEYIILKIIFLQYANKLKKHN